MIALPLLWSALSKLDAKGTLQALAPTSSSTKMFQRDLHQRSLHWQNISKTRTNEQTLAADFAQPQLVSQLTPFYKQVIQIQLVHLWIHDSFWNVCIWCMTTPCFRWKSDSWVPMSWQMTIVALQTYFDLCPLPIDDGWVDYVIQNYFWEDDWWWMPMIDDSKLLLIHSNSWWNMRKHEMKSGYEDPTTMTPTGQK